MDSDESGVAADQRGQGIGRALLRAAARDLTNFGYSVLHVGVLTTNESARRFYEAKGGVAVAQRTFDEEGFPLPETVYTWPDITRVGLCPAV